MSWRLARHGVHTPGIWCVACAKAQLHETPPAAFLGAPPPPAPTSAPSGSETLFELRPVGNRLRHADARVALERLRDTIAAQEQTAPVGGDEP